MAESPAPDEYGFLRDGPLAPLNPTAPGGGVRRSRRRRRNVGLGVMLIVIAAAGAGVAAARLPSGGHGSAHVKILPPAAPTTVPPILESPVPPPEGEPFPVSPIAAESALGHSGGPYVSRARITAMVLEQLECAIGKSRRGMPGFTCARIDVAFFDRYADAWKLRGASWVFVHQWGADREMYVVTVWGHLPSAPPAALTEITTVEIDATTGRTMMEGGPPLPAADANR